MPQYYAKSNPPQRIAEHEQALLKDWEDLLTLYGTSFPETLRAVIAIAAAHHDDGKCNFSFQKLLLHYIGQDIATVWKLSSAHIRDLEKLYHHWEGKQVPHGYLSPMFVNWKPFYEKYGKPAYRLAVLAICYHHVREVEVDKPWLNRLMQEDLQPRFPALHLSAAYLHTLKQPSDLKKEAEWCDFAVAVGLLNRLDYHASAGFHVPVEVSPYKNGQTLAEIVEQALLKKYRGLREVQVFMKAHTDRNVLLTASTGLGKTEAALLWSNGSKLFYTLPLKVSINAIYQRIWNGYGFGQEQTTLLHSDAAAILTQEQTDENSESILLKYKITRMFAFPVTVCTVDQLFTFVYRYRGCEPLLATLSYSKVVLDEVQAYAPKMMAKLIYGLRLITYVGGHFAILTATLPPIFSYFLKQELPEEAQPAEPEHPFYSTFARRHCIAYDAAEIDVHRVLEAAQNRRVLVICNTVAKAQEIYRQLCQLAYQGASNNNAVPTNAPVSDCSTEIHLLHSHFIRKDRALLEKAIQDFGSKEGNGKHGIWVSTQIVEASLDIDFDLLVTEMCPADSLLQRMGRCWRSREYTEKEPNVWIYDTGNGIGTVYRDAVVYQRSVEGLKQYLGKDCFREEDKNQYICYVFDTAALKEAEYGKEIDKELEKLRNIFPTLYSKKESLEEFRNIQSIQVIPNDTYERELQSPPEEPETPWNIDCALRQLEKPENVQKAQQARDYLMNLTFSVRKHGQLAKQADVTPIGKKTDIYRIFLPYSFDETTLQGEGLSGLPETLIW